MQYFTSVQHSGADPWLPAQLPGPPSGRPGRAGRFRGRWTSTLILASLALALIGVGIGLWVAQPGAAYASGTPAGQGFACTATTQVGSGPAFFLAWQEQAGKITGTFLASTGHSQSFTGSRTGTVLTIRSTEGTSHSVLMGHLHAGGMLTISAPGQSGALSCHLEERAAWQAALSREVPPPGAAVTATQSDLINSLTAMLALYTTAGSLPAGTGTGQRPATADTLQGRLHTTQVSISYLPATVPGQESTRSVSVKAVGPQVGVLAAADRAGGCWVVALNQGTATTALTGIPTGTSYGWFTARSHGPCTADNALAQIVQGHGAGWVRNFSTLGRRN